MDKLHKIIEQVIEVKIEQPIDFKRVIDIFQESPIFVYTIKDNSIEQMIEDGWNNPSEDDYNLIKSLYNKKMIECDAEYDGFNISSFK